MKREERVVLVERIVAPDSVDYHVSERHFESDTLCLGEFTKPGVLTWNKSGLDVLPIAGQNDHPFT